MLWSFLAKPCVHLCRFLHEALRNTTGLVVATHGCLYQIQPLQNFRSRFVRCTTCTAWPTVIYMHERTSSKE